jgi:hypothetical protein
MMGLINGTQMTLICMIKYDFYSVNHKNLRYQRSITEN